MRCLAFKIFTFYPSRFQCKALKKLKELASCAIRSGTVNRNFSTVVQVVPAPRVSNRWVVASRGAVLSVITGGGKWVEITTYADPLYQHLIVTAERNLWRCVESGEPRRGRASRRSVLSM